jgi:hypothetical protein
VKDKKNLCSPEHVQGIGKVSGTHLNVFRERP